MVSLLSYVWGTGLSEEERSSKVTELRSELRLEAESQPLARDKDLEAFLIARDYDVARAAEMWRTSQAWRSSTFPIERTEGIERILASPRYRDLGFNCETPPRRVLVFDALCGAFLDGEDEEDLIQAFLIYFEEQIAIIDSQEAPVYNFIHLAVGGPPPWNWGQRLATVLEANYPERLHRAVAYPVPWLLHRVISAMLWFLPQRTQEKWAFAYDVEGLAQACVLEPSAFPAEIREMNAADMAEKVSQYSSKIKWMRNSEGNETTTRSAYLKAGGTEELQVELAEQVEWLEWKCGVDAGYDVGLHVSFEAHANVMVLWEEGRFEDVESSPRTPALGPGRLVFRFDNSYSWFNGKNVYAEVSISRSAAAAEGGP